MKNITGHMNGLYNLIADNTNESITLFSNVLQLNKEDINIKLRRTDISAQVFINTEHIKKKCNTKIVFTVNRLNEYETYEAIQDVIQYLSSVIKIKDRCNKLSKIKLKFL